MNGVEIVKLFITVVSSMMVYRDSSGNKVYIESNDGLYINFSPEDFSEILSRNLSDKDALINLDTKNLANRDKAQKEIMQAFRDLGYIISDGKRFTNTQWILGKPQKVITVDKGKFMIMSKMKW